MSEKEIEIELKFPLRNPEELIAELNEKAKLIAKDIFQKDTYFVPPHRNFLENKYPYEWLRLRETNKGASLDYKHFYPENTEKTDYCDEFQSEVNNVNAIRKIFKSLDFKESVIVEKSRTIWEFKEVEIAVDNVKELGFFIELEAKNDFENPKEGKKFLYNILNELNAEVGEEDLRGYPFLALEKRGHKFG